MERSIDNYLRWKLGQYAKGRHAPNVTLIASDQETPITLEPGESAVAHIKLEMEQEPIVLTDRRFVQEARTIARFEDVASCIWIDKDRDVAAKLKATEFDRIILGLHDGSEIVLEGLGQAVFPLLKLFWFKLGCSRCQVTDASGMNDRFRELLVSACERPKMYVNRNSLSALSICFAGYEHGASDAGVEINFGGRFQRWVEGRFAIFSPAWNWVRILQHTYGDDASSIAALPSLYDEFRAETGSMTEEELWTIMESRMLKARGSKHWRPDDTDTWTKPLSES